MFRIVLRKHVLDYLASRTNANGRKGVSRAVSVRAHSWVRKDLASVLVSGDQPRITAVPDFNAPDPFGAVRQLRCQAKGQVRQTGIEPERVDLSISLSSTKAEPTGAFDEIRG